MVRTQKAYPPRYVDNAAPKGAVNMTTVAYSKTLNGWVVEEVGPDGEVYIAQFYGPLAEQRAKEYAARKEQS